MKGFETILPKDDPLKDGISFGALAKKMHDLIDNTMFADVFFEVEGKRIAAHRNILSCRNDYFKNLLNGEKNLNRHSPIYIPNVKYDVFLQILTFIYTGHVNCCDFQICLDLLYFLVEFNSIQMEEMIYSYFGKCSSIQFFFFKLIF